MKKLLKKILWLFPWLGNILYKKELRTIRNSRYFDEKYYYFLRPDVFASKKDAALHYLLYGWEEKVNPSEFFYTSEYLTAYSDVNFNPLLHYEWFGKNENRNIGIKPFLTERNNKLEENITFARRQITEVQFVVQEDQKSKQNHLNNSITELKNKLSALESKNREIEELKKQLSTINNLLQSKLAEQQNDFESKLAEQQNDFESKLAKAQLEQEKSFLNYQKQEHEKTVAREENTLKLQRDLFEVEKQISIQNEQIVYTDSLKNELEKLQKNIFLQTDLKIKEKINTIPEIRIRNTKHINKEVIASKIENFNSKGITDKKRNRKLIITLTSYPERMYDIQYCLFSLLTQSCKPDMVILWLSEEEFPNKEKDIPSKVLKLQENGLTIKWCKDNLKSYNKLIYALKEFPEDIFIIADDDIFYPQDWTAKLYDAYIQNPNFIHCHRAHKIKLENNTIVPYSNWEKCIVNDYPSYKNFFTGVGGVLCSSKHFHADIIDDKKFKFLAPDGDDIWFWAMAVLNNTKINIVENAINNITYINPERELNLNGEKTLWSTNKLGNNDKQLHSIIVSYPNVLEKLLI